MYDLFQEKKISPYRRPIFKILGHKTPIKEETAQIIENFGTLSKIFLEFFF
jgi:hypothetical protein